MQTTHQPPPQLTPPPGRLEVRLGMKDGRGVESVLDVDPAESLEPAVWTYLRSQKIELESFVLYNETRGRRIDPGWTPEEAELRSGDLIRIGGPGDFPDPLASYRTALAEIKQAGEWPISEDRGAALVHLRVVLRVSAPEHRVLCREVGFPPDDAAVLADWKPRHDRLLDEYRIHLKVVASGRSRGAGVARKLSELRADLGMTPERHHELCREAGVPADVAGELMKGTLPLGTQEKEYMDALTAAMKEDYSLESLARLRKLLVQHKISREQHRRLAADVGMSEDRADGCFEEDSPMPPGRRFYVRELLAAREAKEPSEQSFREVARLREKYQIMRTEHHRLCREWGVSPHRAEELWTLKRIAGTSLGFWIALAVILGVTGLLMHPSSRFLFTTDYKKLLDVKMWISRMEAEGYDKAGYDKQGFDRNGFNRDGFDRSGFNRDGVNREGFDRSGYDRDGYNRQGYNRDGVDRAGFDRRGFNRDGFDKNGLDPYGYDREGYDKAGYDRTGLDRRGYSKEGYDKAGFDRNGFNRKGLNRQGYDRNGLNRLGLDKDGYDKDGLNLQGYDREGYDKNGLDKDGFDRKGFKPDGYDKGGFDKDGYNRQGFDKNGYGRTGFDKTGFDRDGYNAAGYDRKGYDRYGYDRYGFDVYGFNRAGYDRKGYDKSGHDSQGRTRSGRDKSGRDAQGRDRDGRDAKGYDQAGYDQEGRDRQGRDRDGYDTRGFDANGFNREGFGPGGEDLLPGTLNVVADDAGQKFLKVNGETKLVGNAVGPRGAVLERVGQAVTFRYKGRTYERRVFR